VTGSGLIVLCNNFKDFKNALQNVFEVYHQLNLNPNTEFNSAKVLILPKKILKTILAGVIDIKILGIFIKNLTLMDILS